MINFYPVIHSFSFSDLYRKLERKNNEELEYATYPYSNIRFFFWNKDRLPDYLQVDERRIKRFDMFKNIFLRGDYFYLIAYQYFINDSDYDFQNKAEGILTVPIRGKDGETREISFFNELYNALAREKERSNNMLRQEYVLSKDKYMYVNTLIGLLFNDYEELEDAIRKESNQFAKYGVIIKEIYIEIFKNFHSNFIDFLSEENFKRLLCLVYPSKKEVQSFKLAPRKTYRNLKDMEARRQIIKSILENLISRGFISDITTFGQIDDLFNNELV